MATSLFVICLTVYQAFAGNCNQNVGYNSTSLSRDAASGEMFTSYNSFYSNGTVVTYDADNGLDGYGTYKIEDSKDECYTTIKWECCGAITNQTECVTLSPSEDGQGAIGCYVFDKPCIKKCSSDDIGQGWFGNFQLNKLQE